MTEYNNIQTLSLGVCHKVLRDFMVITEIISSWTQLKHTVVSAFGLFFLRLNTFFLSSIIASSSNLLRTFGTESFYSIPVNLFQTSATKSLSTLHVDFNWINIVSNNHGQNF